MQSFFLVWLISNVFTNEIGFGRNTFNDFWAPGVMWDPTKKKVGSFWRYCICIQTNWKYYALTAGFETDSTRIIPDLLKCPALPVGFWKHFELKIKNIFREKNQLKFFLIFEKNLIFLAFATLRLPLGFLKNVSQFVRAALPAIANIYV